MNEMIYRYGKHVIVFMKLGNNCDKRKARILYMIKPNCKLDYSNWNEI